MQTVLMISFISLVLVVLIGSIWYVPFRLSGLLGLTRSWPLFIAAAAAVLLYPASMGPPGSITSATLEAVANISGIFFGFHCFITILLLVSDALRLMISVPDRLTALAAIGVAVVLSVIGAWRAGMLRVTELEISIEGLEHDVTVMHISDVHLGPLRGRAYLERIVGETNRRQPQLVLINGDLVDGASAVDPGVLSPLALLDAPAYFTTGNHESYVDTERVLEIIADQGVRILRNEVVETHGIQLIGLDFMNADQSTYDMHAVNTRTIEKELPKIPLSDDRPVLLMHHSPVGLDSVIDRGVDLMVSGHTHAGQVFPATLLTPLLFPLNKGLYERDDTVFFVSQGAGTFGPRMRLGSSNEINLIRLKAAR